MLVLDGEVLILNVKNLTQLLKNYYITVRLVKIKKMRKEMVKEIPPGGLAWNFKNCKQTFGKCVF